MTRSISTIKWVSGPSGHLAAKIVLDSSVDNNFNIQLNGTQETGDPVIVSHIVVDNMDSAGVVTLNLGPFTYKVAPYTRKTFPVIFSTVAALFNVTVGIVNLTVCNFDPQIPDDVNQVATYNASTVAPNIFDPSSIVTGFISNGGQNYTLPLPPSGVVTYRTAKFYNPKTSGKYYFESTLGYLADGNFGLTTSTFAGSALVGSIANSAGLAGNRIRLNGTTPVIFDSATYGTWDNSGTIGACAVDLSAKRIWFKYGNAPWNNNVTNNPATNVGGIDISSLSSSLYITGVLDNFYETQQDAILTINAGYSFYYTPPDGFIGWPKTG